MRTGRSSSGADVRGRRTRARGRALRSLLLVAGVGALRRWPTGRRSPTAIPTAGARRALLVPATTPRHRFSVDFELRARVPQRHARAAAAGPRRHARGPARRTWRPGWSPRPRAPLRPATAAEGAVQPGGGWLRGRRSPRSPSVSPATASPARAVGGPLRRPARRRRHRHAGPAAIWRPARRAGAPCAASLRPAARRRRSASSSPAWPSSPSRPCGRAGHAPGHRWSWPVGSALAYRAHRKVVAPAVGDRAALRLRAGPRARSTID